jgi:catechol 2,3-dioxygenase-like lactoylglutathione lyase family enzyme
LAPLGFARLSEDGVDGPVAFGVPDADDFAIVAAGEVAPTASAHIERGREPAGGGRVLSGRAGGGGTARAAPGIRTEYSPGYYAAFVNDPDGNNVEAVHHR